ncbi:hypothetical protein [Novispirillum itersonii]|uniref:hypothetical protein n=1 Tax=Novispirillum itersonii TaxID=189 RepID=UPI00037E1D86|nr:hypothetical protein [Novispirillum itersonii]
MLTRTALATAVVSVMAGAAMAQVPPAAVPAAPAAAATTAAGAAADAVQKTVQDAAQTGQTKADQKASDTAAKAQGHQTDLKGTAKDAKAMPDTAQKAGKSAEHRVDDAKKKHGQEITKTAPAQ